MKKLKAGILGLGVGEQHIAGYESHPACEVAALCDVDPAKVNMAREKYPALKVTAEADEILTDPAIDVVSVATYDNFHAEQIRKALAHNKHVFVEKPVCLFEHEAEAIRAALNERPHLQMSSNLILRRCPRFLRLRRMIAEGELGTLFSVEGDYNYGRLHKITDGWRGAIEFYSVLYGGAIHMVDLLLWLTGDRVERVSAFGNNISTRGTAFRYNDMVAGLLQFASGTVGKVSANFGCVYPHFHTLAIYGTRGTFVNEREAGRFITSRDPQAEPEFLREDYPGYHKGDLIRSFLDGILGIRPAEVTADDVMASMSVCFALEKSVRESRVVPVHYY